MSCLSSPVFELELPFADMDMSDLLVFLAEYGPRVEEGMREGFEVRLVENLGVGEDGGAIEDELA